MKVNIHLHLTERERNYLEKCLGEKYIEILVKESIDISKKRLCVECGKWFERTSIKRHNAIYHKGVVAKATL